MHIALREGTEVIISQYKNVDFKMLTPMESHLYKGAAILAIKLQCNADSLSLVNKRPPPPPGQKKPDESFLSHPPKRDNG